MITGRVLRELDYTLLVLALLLALVGVVGVYSLSQGTAEGNLYLRQTARIGLALGICLLIAYVDYRIFIDYAFPLYGLALLGLVAVLIFGNEINGATSWVSIGGVSFQPSELVKVVMMLVIAGYLSNRSDTTLPNRQLFHVAALAAPPVLLIILQRDLGTALMFAPMIGGMLLVSGLRIRVVLMGMLGIALLAPMGWYVLKDYQRERVLVTFDPDRDPQGVGYQTRQAQIAIGSGGLLGRGIGNGLQGQLGFVPESHTDFIFALLAEEIGFLGTITILLLYFLVLSRMIQIAERARDRAGILIVAGAVSLLFSHVLINVGMVLGLVPAIGIPLPLLSYGGSFTVTTFLAIGLVLSVGSHRFLYR